MNYRIRSLSWDPRSSQSFKKQQAVGQHKKVLDDINLDLEAGRVIGLIGPNGAGKSSLIRHLSGWLPAQNGLVELGGRAINAYDPIDRAMHLAVLPQELAIPQGVQVHDLVALGRFALESRLSPEENHAAVDRCIEYVGLSAKKHELVSHLSGGERHLAAFARILAQESSWVILDEPLASLDLAHEHRLFSMLTELAREGRGILVSVHDLNLAAEYCDRLICLHQGRLVADGRPELVLTEDFVQSVWGLRVRLTRNEASGSPYLVHSTPATRQRNRRIHLIGGAGSALNATRLLVRLGYHVSGGIAHGLDSDSALWESLQVEHVTVPPFEAIGDQAFASALALVEQADLTVLCDFPFGPGNARNLELAERASRLVILNGGGGTCSRSWYAGGLAERFANLSKHSELLNWPNFVQRLESDV